MMEMTNTLNNGMCRCCSSEGTFKDIKTKYHWMGEEEVYADMLTDCFDIKISTPEDMDNGICEVCITQLRNAANFKKQVLHTEAQFKRRLQNKEIKNPIKLESMDEDPIESDHLSDPDFSSNEYEVPIKEELEDKPKAKKRAAKATTSRAKKPKAESEPAKKRILTTTIKVESIKVERDESGDEMSLDSKKSKLNTEEVKPNSEKAKPNIGKAKLSTGKAKPSTGKAKLNTGKAKSNNAAAKPSSHINDPAIKKKPKKRAPEIHKHRNNIRVILECTNATPIRCRGDIGFQCSFCIDQFPDPADLKTHTLREHSHDLKTKRDFGWEKTTNAFLVKVDITGLRCDLCAEEMESLELITKHLSETHGKTVYTDIKSQILPFKFENDILKCIFCENVYNTFKVLQEHMIVHYKNYVCELCDSGFVNRQMLRNHVKTHETGVFNCTICSKVFDTLGKQKSHEKQVHSTVKLYRCGHCNEKFRYHVHKVRHLKDFHGVHDTRTCNSCDKVFNSPAALRTHVKRDHLTERSYKCTECDMSFYLKAALAQHAVKHTGIKEFTCSECYKSFGLKKTLFEHMKIHADIRRFKCEHCEKAFVQKCSLRGHIRSKHSDII